MGGPLQNPSKDSQTTIFNSLIQLFGNLTALQDELPLISPTELVSLFTKTCYAMQKKGKYPSISAISTLDDGSVSHTRSSLYTNSSDSDAPPPQITTLPSASEYAESSDLLFQALHSLIKTHSYKQIDTSSSILHVEKSYALLMNEIILKTRFGQRFSCISPSYSDYLPCAVPLDISDLAGREKVILPHPFLYSNTPKRSI